MSAEMLTAKHRQDHHQMQLKHQAAHREMIENHERDHLMLTMQYQAELKSLEESLAQKANQQASCSLSDATCGDGIALLKGLSSPRPAADFLDLLTEDAVPLRAFEQTFYVQRGLLMTSEFFQAKMQRWGQEDLEIPLNVKREALGFLLRRLYTGCPVPVDDFELAAQVLSLAKLWLFDDVAKEIIEALLACCRHADLCVLDRLSEDFDLPILKERAELLRKEHIGKDGLMAMIVSIAEGQIDRHGIIMDPDVKRNKLYQAVLHTHPEKVETLLDVFIQLPIDKCAAVNVYHNPVDLSIKPSFKEIWSQIIGHGVMKKRFADVSCAFLSKMGKVQVFEGQDCRGRSFNAELCLFQVRGVYVKDREWIMDQYLLILKEAAHQLDSGSLSVNVIKEIVACTPEHVLSDERVDASLETMVTAASMHTSQQLLNVLSGCLADLPSRTVQAFQKVVDCT